MARTWLITGASRGIGAAIATAALAAGENVVAGARDVTALTPGDRLLPVTLDVTHPAQIAAAVEAAAGRFGTVDVLVNNAGYGQLGLFEETAREAIERQFATNVFGLFDMTRAVLPLMRRQRRGHIVNLSSIAGLRGSMAGSTYCASKHAVEGHSEALAQEVAPFGIHVTLVEPGFIRTDFLDPSSASFSEHAIADYADMDAQIRGNYTARNHAQAGDPAKVAAGVLQLVNADKPPLRWLAGSDALEVFEAKLARLRADADAWRELTVSTDGHWG